MRRLLRCTPLVFDATKAISRRFGNRTPLYSFLRKCIPRDRKVTFIQAGAADGLTHDPYREFILQGNLHGALVEPLPLQFRKLRRNYSRKKNVTFVNCAISYPPRAMKLFVLEEKFLARHPGREILLLQASTSREHLLSSLSIYGISGVENHILEVSVPGRSIEDIMVDAKFPSFDCIFLDLEGYEPRVLLHLDYRVVKPNVIAYEHIHLGQSTQIVRQHLELMGFSLFEFSQDTVALARRWLK
jgi:FkbM family methyltransferase